jgi:hypothetical protein
LWQQHRIPAKSIQQNLARSCLSTSTAADRLLS